VREALFFEILKFRTLWVFWGGALSLSLFPASFLLLLRLLLVSSHSSTASLVITKQKKTGQTALNLAKALSESGILDK